MLLKSENSILTNKSFNGAFSSLLNLFAFSSHEFLDKAVVGKAVLGVSSSLGAASDAFCFFV